ncbi:MAG: hypothetical protein DMF49_04660 [Acidobacteria bacterium]|nr:MAG: hypothetical protein DMF49_04660 [Acidobacteriota bacterium]
MMKSWVSMLACAAMLLAACFCLSSGAGASPSASVSMGAYVASDFKDESYLKINLKSGSSAFDDAAMASVKGAAPFAALPKSYTGPSVEIHWHFQVDK